MKKRVVGGERLLLLGVSVRALAATVSGSRHARRRFGGGFLSLDYFGDDDLLALARRHRFEALSLDRDLHRPRSLYSLGRAALELNWDAVLYSGGLENRPSLLRHFAARGSILGNCESVVRSIRNPRVLFPFLDAERIPHAQTTVLAAKAPGYGLHLWKASRSGAGGSIRLARPDEPRPRGHVLQRFLEGPVMSAVVVADGREATVLGISRQIVGYRELGGEGFRYGGSIAGPADSLLSPGALDEIVTMARLITRRFGLVGLNGIDLVLHQGRPCLIEVNPRYTASMELLEDLTGCNLFDLHLSALDGRGLPEGPLPTTGSHHRFIAKGILYAGESLRSCHPDLLDRLGCRDRPADGERIECGRPVCTLIAREESPEACMRSLAGVARRVRTLMRSAGSRSGRRLSASPVSW